MGKSRISIKESNPQLAKEWDFEKNTNLNIDNISIGSGLDAYWNCRKCGYGWKARISSRADGKGCPVCAGKVALKGVNDLATVNPQLADEWDYEKNNGIRPDEITAGSGKEFFWKCKSNHSFKKSVAMRSAGSGCPICAGRQVQKGVNDLCTTRPDLVLEWNYEKNGDLRPEMVSAGMRKTVWWKCSKCGNEWERALRERSRSPKCPKCYTPTRNIATHNLQIVNPALAKEWDYDKNMNCGFTPHTINAGSEKKVWWKCIYGHSWQASVKTRNKGIGCPVCSNKKLVIGINDLQTLYPELAKEWDIQKNKKSPREVLAGGKKACFWKCSNGHEWRAQIYDRIKKRTQCPYCLGRKATDGENDLATLFPLIASEWDYELNGEKRPNEYTAHSKERVWWRCRKGHVWQAKITDRTTYLLGCPFCSKDRRTSFPEQAIYYYVKKYFNDAENRNNSLNVEADILIESVKAVIKYDGYFWHKDRLDKDNEKDRRIIDSGYTAIRVREKGLQETASAKNVFYEYKNGQFESLEDAIVSVLKILGCTSVDVDINNDYSNILDLLVTSDKDKSIAKLYPELALDWDYIGNKDITPDMVTAKSRKKIKWKCHICGYQWTTQVLSRINNAGNIRKCPVCSGRLVQTGETDLMTISPEMVRFWDYEKI